MSMDHAANYSDVIESEFIEEHFPSQLKDIRDAIAKVGINWEDLARSTNYDSLDDIEDPDGNIEVAYRNLQAVFEEETGLQLFLGFHDEDDGSRYDDVNGDFWGVTGMYELTEAGKNIGDKVERKFFVEFG